MHRARIGHEIARAGVSNRPDRESVACGVQRHRLAKQIGRIQTCDIHVLTAGVALADRRRQRTARKIRIGKSEEMDRAGIRSRIARAIVEICSNREAVARSVQRDPETELVARLQAGDIDVLPARVALADCRRQRTAREIRIGKSE